MGTRLFVGNLSYNVTELELRETFTGEGIELRSVRIAIDRESGRPRGFAFVETATDEGAKASIEKLGGRMVQGRPLIIEEAQARPAPGAPRPGGAPSAGGPPRFGAPRPAGAPSGGGFGGPPRFGGPSGGGGGGGGPARSFGPPRPPSSGPDRKPETRRERPEKKRSTRPKPEERERGNWRWKGVIDED
jgi:RNA recognition motif-containing protein